MCAWRRAPTSSAASPSRCRTSRTCARCVPPPVPLTPLCVRLCPCARVQCVPALCARVGVRAPEHIYGGLLPARAAEQLAEPTPGCLLLSFTWGSWWGASKEAGAPWALPPTLPAGLRQVRLPADHGCLPALRQPALCQGGGTRQPASQPAREGPGPGPPTYSGAAGPAVLHRHAHGWPMDGLQAANSSGLAGAQCGAGRGGR